VAPGRDSDLHRAPAPRLVPLRVPAGLARHRQGPPARLPGPTEQAALDRFAEFSAAWDGRYPAIVRLWENSWAEFVPFLAFDPEIRTIISTTNAIESLNARFRRAVRARGHFPSEQAALKCLYLVIVSLDPTGRGRRRWTNRWKAALNAFDITFDGRLTAARR
jgi:putative transposase